MSEDFKKAVDVIKGAISSERPILIRHHNDCDGLIAGLAMEEACRNLMQKILIKPFFNLSRNSCKAPYYDFSDFVKDLNTIKRWRAKNGKNALVIILDNGSTSEDYFALECLYETGVDIVVVDHHNPDFEKDETSVCKFLNAHINPHIRGFDSNISAGMLGFELANLLFPNNNYLLPAISGVADCCIGTEIEEYIKLSGKSKTEIMKYSEVIDFVLHNSRFDLDENVFTDFFYNNKLIDIIYTEVEKLSLEKYDSLKEGIEESMLGKINFKFIDLNKYSERYSYPRTGKISEMILTNFKEGFVLANSGDSFTIRQSKTFIPVNDLISILKDKLPFANVKGGGHDNAGTLSFVGAYKERVLDEIKNILSNI